MVLETRPISDKENKIQEFTAHFWNDRVILDDKNLPVGQISADILMSPMTAYFPCGAWHQRHLIL
jgi:hypothetical protein